MERRDARALTLFATGEHECPYLADRRPARTAFVDPQARLDPNIYSQLIGLGFRRSGQFLYQPACRTCAECRSLRIPVNCFRWRRRHRRCWQANADLQVRRLAAVWREEHFQLYRRYVNQRHPGGGMENPTPASYTDFLIAPWCRTLFHEFRHGADGRLLAVAVTDRLSDGLSAVYTFFDTRESHRGLGSFAILWQIEEARRLGLRHLYLGYWIAGARRMAYKAQFRPHELFNGRDWVTVPADARTDGGG